MRFLSAISRVARRKGQLCHVLEIYIGIEMRGLDKIAPETGIDKSFAQFEFYDPTQAKSRFEWATRRESEKIRLQLSNAKMKLIVVPAADV